MSGAFARTRALKAVVPGGGGHPLAMSRWWGKKKPADAEITMMLSSHEQHIVVPWLKTFPKKTSQRFTTWLWPIGTGSITYYYFVTLSERDHAEDMKHRY